MKKLFNEGGKKGKKEKKGKRNCRDYAISYINGARVLEIKDNRYATFSR